MASAPESPWQPTTHATALWLCAAIAAIDDSTCVNVGNRHRHLHNRISTIVSVSFSHLRRRRGSRPNMNKPGFPPGSKGRRIAPCAFTPPHHLFLDQFPRSSHKDRFPPFLEIRSVPSPPFFPVAVFLTNQHLSQFVWEFGPFLESTFPDCVASQRLIQHMESRNATAVRSRPGVAKSTAALTLVRFFASTLLFSVSPLSR